MSNVVKYNTQFRATKQSEFEIGIKPKRYRSGGITSSFVRRHLIDKSKLTIRTFQYIRKNN